MQLKCFQFTFWGRPRTDSWSRIPFEDLPTTLFGEVCYSFNSRGWIDKHPLVLMRPQILRGKNPAVQGMGPNTIEGGGPTLCHVLVYSCTHETPNLVRKNLQSTRDETYYKSRRGPSTRDETYYKSRRGSNPLSAAPYLAQLPTMEHLLSATHCQLEFLWLFRDH